MQLPRLTMQATVRPFERSTEPFAVAAARFTARFPAAAVTLDLGDFTLYELTLGRGRYVEGFARAFNVGPETFGEIGLGRAWGLSLGAGGGSCLETQIPTQDSD